MKVQDGHSLDFSALSTLPSCLPFLLCLLGPIASQSPGIRVFQEGPEAAYMEQS